MCFKTSIFSQLIYIYAIFFHLHHLFLSTIFYSNLLYVKNDYIRYKKSWALRKFMNWQVSFEDSNNQINVYRESAPYLHVHIINTYICCCLSRTTNSIRMHTNCIVIETDPKPVNLHLPHKSSFVCLPSSWTHIACI